MREHPDYRNLIEDLHRFSPKAILNISDVSDYTGMSRKNVRDKLGVQGPINVCTLARTLCEFDGRKRE